MNLVSVEIGRGLDLLAVGALGAGGEAAALAAIAVLGQQKRLPHQWEVAAEIDDLVAGGLARHDPDPHDPLDILRTVGGLELAGLVGVILAAAAGRVVIVLDDLVTAAAALLASHLNPAVRAYLVAGHRSGRPAHDAALQRLNLRPLLSLQMAARGGCGALLACHLVEAAARLISDVDPVRAQRGENPE